MTDLSIEGLSVSYDETVAVHEVSVEVASGEIVAVIGPSGCGKSSLLRAVAGLEPVAGGRIRLGGQDLAGTPTHQRDLGLMFQSHALFPHLSVSENVAFGLRMQQDGGRSSGSQHDRRVAELLDLVGLGGFGSRHVDELSGGEAQRVALARALAPSPGLLMLDEPLGSLDRLLREELIGELRSVFMELGVTALHVTHDQAEAFSLADRVVVLRDGEVCQIGKPVEVWEAPESAFVASFLGHPNVWSAGGETFLVPVRAVRLVGLEPVPSMANDCLVEVVRVEFREGHFRVTARSAGPTLCGIGVGAVSVAFDTDIELMVRDKVFIDLDLKQLVEFSTLT